jgi:hypothetical protein
LNTHRCQFFWKPNNDFGRYGRAGSNAGLQHISRTGAINGLDGGDTLSKGCTTLRTEFLRPQRDVAATKPKAAEA